MGLIDAIKNVFVKKSDHAEEPVNDEKATPGAMAGVRHAVDAHAAAYHPSAASGLARAIVPTPQPLPPSAESRRAHRGVPVRAFGGGPVDEAQKKQGARRVAAVGSAKKAPKKEKYHPPRTQHRHHRHGYRHAYE
jgi:hypothetical protein